MNARIASRLLAIADIRDIRDTLRRRVCKNSAQVRDTVRRLGEVEDTMRVLSGLPMAGTLDLVCKLRAERDGPMAEYVALTSAYDDEEASAL